MVPMGERAGLTIILINGGHTGSGLKGTPVGSSIPSGTQSSLGLGHGLGFALLPLPKQKAQGKREGQSQPQT